MGLESSSNVSPTTAPIPITVFENEQIYMAFENSIIKQVNERLDEKLAHRHNIYIGIATVIITAIIAISGYVVRLVLDHRVKTQVREQFAQETAKFVQEAEFLPRTTTLEIQLGQMNSAEAVDGNEFKRAIDEFESLYSAFVTPGLTDIIQKDVNPAETSSEAITLQVAQVRERQLTNSFDFLVQILSKVGRVSEFERLRKIAPRLLFGSDIALQSLSQSYGRLVIGAAGAPETWTEGKTDHETFLKYRDWSKRARENSNFSELFYLFEAIVWHLEGWEANKIEELLRDIDGLNDEDGKNYEGLLTNLATEGFRIGSPNAESERVANRTREFIAAYASSSTRVARVKKEISK